MSKNFTLAIGGIPSPELKILGPYLQSSPVKQIKPIKNSDASLLNLEDPLNMTRYVQAIYLEKKYHN